MALAGWPTLTFRIALDSDPLDATPSFTDLSGIYSIDTDRGRPDELSDVPPSSATFVLPNLARALDPTYTGGPYYPKLTANRRLQFRARYGSTTYSVYDGFANSFVQSVDGDGNALCTIPATGALKFLPPNKLEPVHPWIVGDPVYGLVGSAIVGGQLIFPNDNELPGDRINTILDLWPFPGSMRDIDDGNTQLGRNGTPHTGPIDSNETAASYIKKIVDSEDGRWFESANGKLTFWARDHWRSTTSQNTSQLVLSDDGTGDAGYDPRLLTEDPADARYIRNIISRDRSDWTSPIVAIDSTSVDLNGPLTDDRTILTRYPADVLNQVAWWKTKFAVASVRISSITLEPRSNPDVLFPAVLGLELGDRITVKRKIAGVGATFNRDYWIERIQHSIHADASWTTTWALAPADTALPWSLASLADLVSLGSVTPAPALDTDDVFPISMPGAPPGTRF